MPDRPTLQRLVEAVTWALLGTLLVEPLSEPGQALSDHRAVPVIAERCDANESGVQLPPSSRQFSATGIAVSQVEMKTGCQPAADEMPTAARSVPPTCWYSLSAVR
jgi:hypothetical protein